jgi:hypothetical protein
MTTIVAIERAGARGAAARLADGERIGCGIGLIGQITQKMTATVPSCIANAARSTR